MIELIEKNRDAIAELCRRFHVVRLEVFGSAVGGRFDPQGSDLDFLKCPGFSKGPRPC